MRHVAPEVVGTITADMGEKFQVNNQSVMSGHLQVFDDDGSLVVRRLSPTECEVLMGWEPGWTAEGVDDHMCAVAIAETHRYRMCGNGVVSPVAYWFARRYEEARSDAAEDDR